jgi:hypothetical protein
MSWLGTRRYGPLQSTVGVFLQQGGSMRAPAANRIDYHHVNADNRKVAMSRLPGQAGMDPDRGHVRLLPTPNRRRPLMRIHRSPRTTPPQQQQRTHTAAIGRLGRPRTLESCRAREKLEREWWRRPHHPPAPRSVSSQSNFWLDFRFRWANEQLVHFSAAASSCTQLIGTGGGGGPRA